MLDNIRRFFRNKKNLYTLIALIIIYWVGIVMFKAILSAQNKTDYEEVLWSEFLEMVDAGEIDTVYYDGNTSEYIEFTLLNDETREMTREERADYKYPNESWRKTLNPKTETRTDGMRQMLIEKGVNIRYKKNQELIDTCTTIAGLTAPIIWLLIILKIVNGSSKGFSQAEVIQKSSVRFDDVIGQDEVLEDLRFITKLIKNVKLGKDMGVSIPRGILLSGAPGTGKTLIAKAIAGEAGVPFISVSGSDFKEMFVGMGARRVRQIFEIARINAPCILFIDEIDAVAGSRESVQHISSEDTQTINALLKEMDGFTDREGVFIFAATNYPDKLDSALRRAGRFDREVTINPPRDWRVRKQLLEHYLSDKPVAEDVDLDTLSKQLVGFTGADIAAICNESGIVAIMSDKSVIDKDSIEEAIDKKVFHGNRSKSEHYKDDKITVAYHEAGHAVMKYLTGEAISRASIMGTTSGVGGAVFGEDTESVFVTKDGLKNRVMCCYGGRASEEIKFGDVTTGASSDISKATQYMLRYLQKFGFDEDFGLVDVELLRDAGFVDGEDTTERLSEMSKRLYSETLEQLKANYDKVEVLAKALLESETLSGDEISELLGAKES